MKKMILTFTGLFIVGMSVLFAQDAQSIKSDVEYAEAKSSDTEIVLINTNEIPGVINKTLSPNYVRPKRRTIYSDHYTQSYIVYDQRKKKTYVYQKKSGTILELHRSKK